MSVLDTTPRTFQNDIPSEDCKAVAVLQKIKGITLPVKDSVHTPLLFPTCQPSIERQRASLDEEPVDLSAPVDAILNGRPEASKTILYLAYGSNLSAETFLGKRGIRPISQVNVVVPELVMTFDLAGIPYVEPCFANTAYRSSKASILDSPSITDSEKTPLLTSNQTPKSISPCWHYWPKGLVGVVYEVTPADFAHIIATEGGGSSYQDVLVDCHVLPSGTSEVPSHPITAPFRAHTLFSPITYPGQPPPINGGRSGRPDPEHAQPSARYLKLITDGADEHDLPAEYKEYLHSLQPYTITSNRQRLGKFVFMSIWFPIIMALFGLGRLFRGKDGKSPQWFIRLSGAMFRGVWISYDGFFKGLFGDGERTVEKDEDIKNVGGRRGRRLVKKRKELGVQEKGMVDHNV